MPQFLHLTLHKSGSISTAVSGSFTESRLNEIVAAHGKTLALYRITDEGKFIEVYNEETFGLVRRLVAFRLTGGTRDHVAVTSDSGRIAILDWDSKTRKFVTLHRETFGKTGVRRVVAGEYVAVDPKGRALMLGAVEKQKFVYILNRDASGRLAIGSPLEAHKSHQITFDLCGLNVGYENPVFVSLETNYEALEQPVKLDVAGKPPKPQTKQLAFWELDLGLNHVVKKCSLNCDRTASCIIPVPAGAEFSEGPGGVIVCCENFIQFKKPDHPEVVCALPRRLEMESSRGVLVAAWAGHRMKDFYFVLLQSEYGDLYRVEIVNNGPTVTELNVRYFDSIPPATSLCILKSGYLFAASEMGDHTIYQFTGVGDDELRFVASSLHPSGRTAIVPFKPRRLKNIVPVSEWQSMGPMTDLKVIDCVGDAQTPQIYALCGAGPRGHLNILRQGIQVEEMAASEVPGYPTGLWTLSEFYSDENHKYILLSFSSATLVLRVSDAIEEQTETLFVTDKATLHAGCLADDSHLQVNEDGWRLLQRISLDDDSNVERRILEWKAPSGKRVLCAATNATQLVLSVSGGLIIYFELQQIGGRLLDEIGSHDIGHEVNCIAIQPTPQGALRSNFVAVGGLDRSVRVLSLAKEKILLRQVGIQMLSADSHAESLAICKLPFSQTESEENHFGTTLCIGLSTGVFLRMNVDSNTGQLQPHKRQKFLGASPVRLVPVTIQVPSLQGEGTDSVAGLFRLGCLVYDTIHYAASLNSVHCSSGFVAISGNVLKIVSVSIDPQDKLFSSVRVPLEYTPRKATVFPPPPTIQERQEARLQGMPIMLLPPSAQRPWQIATIESDHNAFDLATKQDIAKALRDVSLDGDEGESAAPNEESEENLPPSETQIGTFKAGESKWGGCLRLISPTAPAHIVQTIPFGPDEAPTSITVCQFLEYPEHPALVVGTVTAFNLRSKKCQIGHLKVYVYDQEGQLSLHHETPVEDIPLALCSWAGQLLAAIGHRIRLYTLGKKRLLKRCEYKNLPCGVNWLRVSGDRIFASDVREGFHVIKYSPLENIFQVMGDMIVPRWVTCGEILDPYTIMGGDKFDNIFVVRLPPTGIKDTELYDTTGLKVRGDTPYLTGQCHKLDRLCEFHVGDLPTAMQKCLLAPGGSEIVLFGTILGALGAMLPLQTQKEVEMLQHLEMLLRNEDISIIGRDHIFFRSAYFPVKNVIDGDLLQVYPSLTPERQSWIAQQIDKTPSDVLRLLDDVRSRII